MTIIIRNYLQLDPKLYEELHKPSAMDILLHRTDALLCAGSTFYVREQPEHNHPAYIYIHNLDQVLNLGRYDDTIHYEHGRWFYTITGCTREFHDNYTALSKLKRRTARSGAKGAG